MSESIKCGSMPLQLIFGVCVTVDKLKIDECLVSLLLDSQIDIGDVPLLPEV